MKRFTGLVLGVAAALAGCGDNSKECGSGTTDVDGVCTGVGSGSGAVCGDGTMLDEASGTCVIDPSACQAGTVLIAGDCVDPTAGLTADVTEAAEPNGLSVGGEDSNEPAGQFDLKPIGETVVIQGNISAHSDTNEDGSPTADIDSYLFEATAPTLLEVSVDGVQGAIGGFVMLGDPGDEQVADWTRIGVATTGDTSKRQVYLPKAGIYLLAIADTRTILNQDAVGDASDKYFVSIEQKALPTATSVTLTGGVGSTTGTITDGEVNVVSVVAPVGVGEVNLEAFDEDFTATAVVTSGNNVLGMADESKDSGFGDSPALVRFANVSATTPTLVIVDHVINTADAATDYRVSFDHVDAVAAKTDGTTATVVNAVDLADPSDFLIRDYQYLYFDATAANQTFGLNLSFNVPVNGAIMNSSLQTIATMTFNNNEATYQTYKGTLRVPAAGRYFILAQAPNKAVPSNIVLTSTITPVVPATTLVLGTPLNAQAAGTFNSSVFDYNASTEKWQTALLSANGAAGGATVRAFDPDNSYGLLNDLTVTSPSGAGTVTGPELEDVGPILELSASSALVGFLTPTLPDHLLVVVSTDNAAGTWSLDPEKRVYTDEGEHNDTYTVTHATETFPSVTDHTKRYFIKSTPGNTVTVTVDPATLLDAQIRQLAVDEGNLVSPADDNGDNGDETLEVTVDSSGYAAFEVDDATGIGVGGFSITIAVAKPPAAPAGYYTVGTGTATWTNICNMPGAKDLTPANRDEGISAPVTLPTGFTFFGDAATEAVVSTNGWVSFDTTSDENSASASPFEALPSFNAAPEMLAPYWVDLVNARVCSLTSGSKITFQWRGTEFFIGTDDAFQLVLDASDKSIQFVYAPFHQGTVTDGFGALAGGQVDDSDGQTVFFTNQTTLAGKSFKLTH